MALAARRRTSPFVKGDGFFSLFFLQNVGECVEKRENKKSFYFIFEALRIGRNSRGKVNQPPY